MKKIKYIGKNKFELNGIKRVPGEEFEVDNWTYSQLINQRNFSNNITKEKKAKDKKAVKK